MPSPQKHRSGRIRGMITLSCWFGFDILIFRTYCAFFLPDLLKEGSFHGYNLSWTRQYWLMAHFPGVGSTCVFRDAMSVNSSQPFKLVSIAPKAPPNTAVDEQFLGGIAREDISKTTRASIACLSCKKHRTKVNSSIFLPDFSMMFPTKSDNVSWQYLV